MQTSTVVAQERYKRRLQDVALADAANLLEIVTMVSLALIMLVVSKRRSGWRQLLTKK